jgi:hypothetical protein
MPIVSGNEPPPPRNARGSLLGWVFPLLFFGPIIYNFVRSATRGLLTDQQLLIVGGGLIGLAALVAIGRRVGQSRANTTTSLPTSYTPPQNVAPLSRATPVNREQPPNRAPGDKPYMPSPPRFEPIITGKVLLVGIVLAALFGCIGLALLSASI